MKIINLALLTAACAAGVSCAPEISVDQIPQAVKVAFEKSYPNARDIEWEKEEADEYEVSFELADSEEISVVYNSQGVEQEVEREIPVSQLPEAVKTALNGKKIKEAEEIKKNGQVYYEVEVGGKDLYFDASGKALPDPDED